MNTIVSLIAVAVVPFGGVHAGYPGPGCPDAGEAAIAEGTFCNSINVSCPSPTVGFGYDCDRSKGDNSGGKWYVELPQAKTNIFSVTVEQ